MRPALKAWGVYFAAVLLGFAPVPPVSVAEVPKAKKADTAGAARILSDCRREGPRPA